MSNTGAAVDGGMTGICRGAHARLADVETARTMIDAVGLATVVVDEKNMDAVMGLSASGGWTFGQTLVWQSFAEAGVKVLVRRRGTM